MTSKDTQFHSAEIRPYNSPSLVAFGSIQNFVLSGVDGGGDASNTNDGQES